MKPESKLWKKVKTNLPDIFFTRIESWALPGVPDIYGCKDEIMFWIELKTVTKRNTLQLSPFQKRWHFSHSLQGGRSFIMLETHEPLLLSIFPSSIAISIAALSPKYAPKSWAMPASPAAWAEIQDYILHSPLLKPEAPPV
tara:strand:- start:102 stop:524 length:423 start_codon:yes stop_codon:yes gene_type:complete